MEIAIIDKQQRFYNDVNYYVQKKFDGVEFTLFHDPKELLNHKKIYDLVCLDQTSYKESVNNRVFNKHVKDIVCVCYNGELCSITNALNVQVVSEVDIEEIITHKIRDFIKEEERLKQIEEKRKKYLSKYFFMYFVIMVLAITIDRSGNVSKLAPMIMVLGGGCINSFF